MKLPVRIGITVCCMISIFSCSKTSSSISHEDMAHIYVEMLMRDQWINSNYSERTNADTSFVYASILEEYGYSREDYIESVNFYVDHPEILTSIMQRTINLLEGREMVLENLIRQRDEHQRDSTEKARVKAELEEVIRSLPAPDWEYSDSLYEYTGPEYELGHVYPDEYKELKTLELDSLERDRSRLAVLKRDSLTLDSLIRKSSMADSLLVKEKLDSLKVTFLEKEMKKLDSLISSMKSKPDTTKKEDKCQPKELQQNTSIPFRIKGL